MLASLRIPYLVMAGDVDEDTRPAEKPLDYLERIALAKLEAVWSRLRREGNPSGASEGVAAILVADTTVVIDDAIVGKPVDVADAAATLTRLVGRSHTVFTRYLIARASRGAQATGAVLAARTVETEVRLRSAEVDEVLAYAATGEGLDKAGAYAAQGIGAFLVEGVIGSYTNVVGLPACELVSDLRRTGLLGVFPPIIAE